MPILTFSQCYSIYIARESAEQNLTGRNIVFIYTGRWKYLRIQLPHIYRELRKNGGVIDEVRFMMIKYDKQTHQHLLHFTEVANAVSKIEIFTLRYLSRPYEKQGDEHYNDPYYDIFSEIVLQPYNKYFKLDDDVVYIHPGAFTAMIQRKNASQCFIHFFNIAGSNWRCSWWHQKHKLYEETNPNLSFDYDPFGKCGWKSSDCAELTLRTFLHHHKKNQLDKYFIDSGGLYLITDRKRFSINAFLLDKDLIDIEAMMKTGPISKDDEQWWTETYSSKVANPNCVVGGALVVHFAYRTVAMKMLKLGLLQKFEEIVTESKESFEVEPNIWKALGYESG